MKLGIGVIFHLLLFIPLLAGLIWQVLSTFQLFFQFRTSIDITLERPENIVLPGVTVCLEIDVYNRSAFRSIYPSINLNTITSQMMKQKYLEAPINTISKYSVLVENSSINCTVRCTRSSRFVVNNSYCQDVSCDRYSPLVTNIMQLKSRELLKCWTYFSRSVTDSQLVEPANFERDFITINVNSTKSSIVYIYIHNSNFTPYIESVSYQTLSTSRIAKANLDYSLTTMNFLPPPYATMCDYYEQYGNEGREGCLKNCRIGWFKTTYGIWPYTVPARETEPYCFDKDNIWERLDMRSIVQSTNARCDRRCKQRDCRLTSYEMTVRITESLDIPTPAPTSVASHPVREPTYEANQTLTINIQRPKKMDISYTHRETQRFVEFFTYVGSAFGLWFDVSFFTILNAIFRYGQRLCHMHNSQPQSGQKTRHRGGYGLMRSAFGTNSRKRRPGSEMDNFFERHYTGLHNNNNNNSSNISRIAPVESRHQRMRHYAYGYY